MKVLIDDIKGQPLDKYLTAANRKKLQDKRYLYVVQSYADTKTGVLKLGEGHGPGRLVEYTHFHGRVNPRYPCLGVKIYFLMTTTYKSHVEKKKTKIWQLEKKLKQFYKPDIKQVARGDERLKITPKTLIDTIKRFEPNYTDARPHARYAGPEPVSDSDDEPIAMRTRSQTRPPKRVRKKPTRYSP
jgi:hypothetical protein